MSKKVRFTATRISQFECSPDKQQSFIWDSNTQGLGLRKTPRGNPSYIFPPKWFFARVLISLDSCILNDQSRGFTGFLPRDLGVPSANRPTLNPNSSNSLSSASLALRSARFSLVSRP
jgi:hypothetical protein